MKKYIVILFLLFFTSCYEEQVTVHKTPEESGRTRCDPKDRTGCLCKDGSKFDSTDPTACDSNGGIERWLCD